MAVTNEGMTTYSKMDVQVVLICSDLKGSITPNDPFRNRYLVIFSTTSRIIATCSLLGPSMQLSRSSSILWFSLKMFDCRVQILRTDGGEVESRDKSLNQIIRHRMGKLNASTGPI
ncbi:unnamed protein product [Albugo candida]|uniref:Uncharacterized protein n=1 Tax=Albugo candida TaxID=65357 RepID=A0A024FVV0_9STRA|nr:unnamed protein product [Albugo candida]|eukprot:CCI11161.1 unnamed protein product [Albugo candida]